MSAILALFVQPSQVVGCVLGWTWVLVLIE